MNKDQDLERALFRYGLIHPLLDDSLSPGEKSALRKQILSKTYDIPHSNRTTISERTLRQYLQWYREGGFSALMQCKRKDRGEVRAISEEVLKKAFTLKEELPTRSIREIIEMLELSGEVIPGSVKHSTLSRLVSRHTGQLRIPSGGKTFRRFQKDNVNDTWQSDVKHCIYLPDPQKPKEYVKTYLIAFLDDKSRRVCGKIYWAENGSNVEDCFRKALIQMGVPRCFYTDNAKIYKTKRLQTICAELGSQLKYCQPYSPQSKGKLEKFNAYVDRSFEPEARRLGIQTLEELNQYFEVWLAENYNHKVHAEIRRTPLEAHQSEQANLRYVTPEELRKIFIQRQVRKADNAATVSLNGNLYKIEGFLARKKVELRYDAKDLSCVEVYYNGQQYNNAEPLVIRANVWDGEKEAVTVVPKQDETAGEKTLQTSFLKLLQEKHEQRLKDKAHRIHYAKLYQKEDDPHV
ncbi:MAG: DDE-type integrase/transposase/recombinase [Desulfitobacteriaceae bacterium]|nr:DDE-type integrase/transposase/recombinase [Desulfitobacteriaceae bacterium]MDD4347306.1 DDE-type integrase/transposase/recombinase [Desulfitobacteriaceae bacterium]MDD4402751.1 DDE-type integrase/transposase/recombinase [Desulfitobacteriaceae bacterium]